MARKSGVGAWLFGTVRTSPITSSTAGIDLLVLRELMGHASPESTAAYVHLSSATLAAEFAKARAATR
jgi:integrase